GCQYQQSILPFNDAYLLFFYQCALKDVLLIEQSFIGCPHLPALSFGSFDKKWLFLHAQEFTKCEFQKKQFSHVCTLAGKPEESRSGVTRGLQ
ncbi:hypothetical protein, partial [Desulfosarcina sp.]|uniref:hypothetical protein n=1 Tax=Desulfosarcina sp. TaxID=2027861 RepID=UPI0029B06B1D